MGSFLRKNYEIVLIQCLYCRFTVVHRTEVIKKTLNPTWKPFTISVRALCNGDYDR